LGKEVSPATLYFVRRMGEDGAILDRLPAVREPVARETGGFNV